MVTAMLPIYMNFVTRGDTVKVLEPETGHIFRMPVICVRSFFNRTLSRRQRAHRAWTMAAVTLFLVLTLTVVFLNSQAGFAVYYNGEQIGSAKSMKDINAVVADAEEQLQKIFGQDVSLDGAISVTAGLGVKADDTENIKNAILGEIDGLTQMHVLEVNGVAVGAAESETELLGILTDILNDFTTEQTTAIRFVDTLRLTRRYIGDDVTQDLAEIKSLLDPRNAASPFALTVETTEQKQYTELVACDVDFIEDDAVYVGSTVVVKPGAPGENLVTENTVRLNGKPQFTQIVSTTPIKAPRAELVAVGTAPRPKTASYGSYIWPAEGIITSGFGPRRGFGSSNHQGIDIAGFYGDDIVAADGGVVIKADWFSGYGKLVAIEHDNGDITYYGHCAKILVDVGERVYQGQSIALMGQTGVSSGVHCHFEIRKNGQPVDPAKYLP
jgi:murein DD-endopeptidase MepM/ murein hydrolase activator NlpD